MLKVIEEKRGQEGRRDLKSEQLKACDVSEVGRAKRRQVCTPCNLGKTTTSTTAGTQHQNEIMFKFPKTKNPHNDSMLVIK
jgi:hypothetical protein